MGREKLPLPRPGLPSWHACRTCLVAGSVAHIRLIWASAHCSNCASAETPRQEIRKHTSSVLLPCCCSLLIFEWLHCEGCAACVPVAMLASHVE